MTFARLLIIAIILIDSVFWLLSIRSAHMTVLTIWLPSKPALSWFVLIVVMILAAIVRVIVGQAIMIADYLALTHMSRTFPWLNRCVPSRQATNLSSCDWIDENRRWRETISPLPWPKIFIRTSTCVETRLRCRRIID